MLMYYLTRNITRTILLAHLFSGTLAYAITRRQSIQLKKNQVRMTLIAITISTIQSSYLAYKIENKK